MFFRKKDWQESGSFDLWKKKSASCAHEISGKRERGLFAIFNKTNVMSIAYTTNHPFSHFWSNGGKKRHANGDPRRCALCANSMSIVLKRTTWKLHQLWKYNRIGARSTWKLDTLWIHHTLRTHTHIQHMPWIDVGVCYKDCYSVSCQSNRSI